MSEKNRKKIKVRIKSVSEPDPEPVPPPEPEPEYMFEDKPYIPPSTPPSTPPPENNVADEIEEIKRQQSSTNFKLNILFVALTAVGLFCGRGCIRKLIH